MSRKSRRNTVTNTKTKPDANKQLIIMCISIILMCFCISQVVNLTKYTLGKEVDPGKLKVYKWVCLLVEGDQDKK